MVVVGIPRTARAQLNPQGGHHSDRPTDTGFNGGVTSAGGYAAAVPLELPEARGGLPVPVRIVSGSRRVGAAGLGWDVPLSYVRDDTSFAHRRPAGVTGAAPFARRSVSLVLDGGHIEFVKTDVDTWVSRNAALNLKVIASGNAFRMYDGEGRTYVFDLPVATSGMVLLTAITGPTANTVRLGYDLRTDLDHAAFGSRDNVVAVDLVSVDYNVDAAGCAKNTVVLAYDQGLPRMSYATGFGPAGGPTTNGLRSSVLFTRTTQLKTVFVKSRATCGAAPETVRRYELHYDADGDLPHLSRMSSVTLFGRQGTPEATTPVPVAAYGYGRATFDNESGRHVRYDRTYTVRWPAGPPADLHISGTSTGESLFGAPLPEPSFEGTNYRTWQNLIDFNGDGRPDYVFHNRSDATSFAGHLASPLWLAPNLPGAGRTTTLAGPPVAAFNQAGDVPRGPIEMGVTNAWHDDRRDNRMMIDFAHRRAIDFNGDGRIDIVDSLEQTGHWVVYFNTPMPTGGQGPAGTDPGSIMWVKKSFKIGALAEMVLRLPPGSGATWNGYLPLTGRTTGRPEEYTVCQTLHGVNWVDDSAAWGDGCSVADQRRVPQELTVTDWDLGDVNGDGFPDVTFNSQVTAETGVVDTPLGNATSTATGFHRLIMRDQLRFAPSAGNNVLVAFNVLGVQIRSEANNIFSAPVVIRRDDRCGVARWTNGVSNCQLVDVDGDGIVDHVSGTVAQLGTGIVGDPADPTPSFFSAADLVTLPAPLGRGISGATACPHPTDTAAVFGLTALRDLNGDGLPDFIDYQGVHLGTGVGFEDRIDDVTKHLQPESESVACSGAGASTYAGLYDMNGDGKADYVVRTGAGLEVYELGLGSSPGLPEAGLLTRIDNGYGGSTNIAYRSAKEEVLANNYVPYGEIIASSVQTKGVDGNGHDIVPTRYAQSGSRMVFDPFADRFISTGFLRTLSLTRRSDETLATITDRLGLGPVLSDSTLRFARYLELGEVSNVTTLSGDLGADPWALLDRATPATGPASVINEHERSSWQARAHMSTTSLGWDDCEDIVFPYDFDASVAYLDAHSVDRPPLCRQYGLVYPKDTIARAGEPGRPAGGYTQTHTAIHRIDDHGRVTELRQYNDELDRDDDVCVLTEYAQPDGAPPVGVLSAVATRSVHPCRDGVVGAAILSRELYEYDHLPSARVSTGLVTGQTVERHAGDTGELRASIRVFDASYDAFGNPTSVVSVREDGAQRTETLHYDPFGLAVTDLATTTSAGPTTIPALNRHLELDPLTLQLLTETDPNGTRRGITYDGFLRPVFETVEPAGSAVGHVKVASATRYVGFSTADAAPEGRHIDHTRFVELASDQTAGAGLDRNAGDRNTRNTATYLDELGRETRTLSALGADYSTPHVVVGAVLYDELGRVKFAADPYPSTQSLASTYGTTYVERLDGRRGCMFRANGVWGSVNLNDPPVAPSPTDEASERYTTCAFHSFRNNRHLVWSIDPTSYAPGATNPSTRRSELDAVGRIRTVFTFGDFRSILVPLDRATFTYDLLGHRASMTRSLSVVDDQSITTTTWRTDSLDQMFEFQEPGNALRSYLYSNWGELRETSWFDRTTATNKQVVQRYDALGRVIHRDERARLTGLPASDGDVDPESVNDYAYDTPVNPRPSSVTTNVIGRLVTATAPTMRTTMSYDGFGRTKTYTFEDNGAPWGGVVQYNNYHADGSPLRIDLAVPDNAGGVESVTYDQDSAGRLRSIGYVNAGSSLSLFHATQIDPLGRIREATYGATTYHADYADTGRRLLGGVSLVSPVASREVLFGRADPLSRETDRTEIVNGRVNGVVTMGAPTVSTLSTYDSLGRLITSSRDDAAGSSLRELSYDAQGNVRSQHVPGGGLGGTSVSRTALLPDFASADKDRVCRVSYDGVAPGPATGCNVLYDDIGNIVAQSLPTTLRTLSYLPGGRPRTISDTLGSSAHFRYDAFGATQDTETQSTTTSLQRHDRSYGTMVKHRVANNAAGIGLRRITGPGGFAAVRYGNTGPWVFQFGEQNGTRFFSDAAGNVIQENEYLPFGDTKAGGLAVGASRYSPEQWNGGDALAGLGVNHLGARLYDPALGRFLSRDPLFIPRTGATTNPYAFAMNDPVNASDPTGLETRRTKADPNWFLVYVLGKDLAMRYTKDDVLQPPADPFPAGEDYAPAIGPVAALASSALESKESAKPDHLGLVLLQRYLDGGGDWVVNNPTVSRAIMRDRVLATDAADHLNQEILKDLSPGTHPIKLQYHSVTSENFTQARFLGYLHGSNSTVGDFRITGQYTVSANPSGPKQVDVSAIYNWNDIIDANADAGDTKYDLAGSAVNLWATGSLPHGYGIHIYWKTNAIIKVDPGSGPPSHGAGWPYGPTIEDGSTDWIGHPPGPIDLSH